MTILAEEYTMEAVGFGWRLQHLPEDEAWYEIEAWSESRAIEITRLALDDSWDVVHVLRDFAWTGYEEVDTE